MSKKIGSIAKQIPAYKAAEATSKIFPTSAMITGKDWKRTTFGRMVQKPSTKFPETKTDNSAAAIALAAGEAAMATAKEKEKARLRASSGRRSLISTSGAGILEPVTTNKKKLTGE